MKKFTSFIFENKGKMEDHFFNSFDNLYLSYLASIPQYFR